MLKYISIVKKFFYLSIIALALLLVASISLSYIYKDKIVQLFIEEANEHIKTPVNVESISFSLLEKFPDLSITMDNILIQEGLKGSTKPLAKAKHMYFTFSLIDFIQGNYVVDQVFLENAEVFLKLTKSGENNYTIIERDSSRGGSGMTFNLDKIRLKKVLINYKDEKREQDHTLFANDVSAKLTSIQNVFEISVQGEVISHKVKIREDSYFKDKELSLNTRLIYDQGKDSLSILPSEVKVNNSKFLVEGNYRGAEKNKIDIQVKGDNTDIQTILTLLPENIYQKLKVYRSRGNVYFGGRLKGEINEAGSPALDIDFGCKDASFFHPQFNKEIKHVYLEGNFNNTNVYDLKSAILRLNNVSGNLDSRDFKGDMTLKNFNDYHLKCELDGEFNVKSLLDFYPVEDVKKASGLVNLDISFIGRLNNLKLKGGGTQIKTSGEILLKDLDFNLKESNLPFRQFNGSFIFKNDNLAISDFSGSIGNSKFLLNGFFKNMLAYLIFDDQPLGIEADLKSGMLDIDELLTGNVKEQSQTAEGKQFYSSFHISPKLVLSFNCDVDHIKFRRFKGEHLKGQLKVKNQVATGDNININVAGGSMALDGTVDAGKKDNIEVMTQASFQRIDIDSIFYIFHNFNQDFLMDKHLKGQIYAEVNSYMVFDNNLRLDTKKFKSEVGISIKNGELNEFEPMQKLSKYVEEESLANLKFPELKNIIRINDRTIFLPDMKVQSNVSAIRVNGTHTFDQEIDYSLQIPLRDFKKKDKDEAFGPIEDDGLSNSKLFLTIKGTTDNYKIAYDKEAVKQKIKKDFKKEGRELREVFKSKGKKDKKAKELNEDEYFDFGEGNK